ncbi:MAG: hypothetical protein KA974_06825 [Saprospiraceae bacterium]|nr:hypothetical protein [Saprospiraceae bacterium]
MNNNIITNIPNFTMASCCKFIFIIILLLIIQVQLFSQVYYNNDYFYQHYLSDQQFTLQLAPVDFQKFAEEDKIKKYYNRFAAPVDVAIDCQNEGVWTNLPNGDGVWHLNITVPKALGIVLLLENVNIPVGAKLCAIHPETKKVETQFNHYNINKNQKATIGFIAGQSLVLEYYEPYAVRGKGYFNIFSIYEAYNKENLFDPNYEFNEYGGGGTGFGTAWACHKNINCPEGDNWQQQKTSVARIMMVLEEGTGWCSGSMLNDVPQDGKKYFLSANHCQNGYTPLYDFWTFDFGYESTSCADPFEEPSKITLTGCTHKANHLNTDFLLLELNQSPPEGTQFSGWNRDAEIIPPSTVLIHHPSGDIKKISMENQPALIFNNNINWNNGDTTPAYSHLRMVLDVGTFQPGSSGCPFFNPAGQIVAQLHGGNSSCNQFIAYGGRFAISWDGATASERLKDWLDPNNTSTTSIDAFVPPVSQTASVSGYIYNNGQSLPNTLVVLSGNGVNLQTSTDNSGYYSFINVPRTADLTVTPQRTEDYFSALTTFDMVLTQKHILQLDTFTTIVKHIAADVNLSNSITTFDLVSMRKIILQIDQTLTAPVWQFISQNYDPTLGVGSRNSIITSTANGDVQNVNFIGIKAGDVNGSY